MPGEPYDSSLAYRARNSSPLLLDQMIWPGIIAPAIESAEHAPFLTAEQKRDIVYNNAARFLRLTDEQIAGHHAR